jgi:hypothetical protein
VDTKATEDWHVVIGMATEANVVKKWKQPQGMEQSRKENLNRTFNNTEVQ